MKRACLILLLLSPCLGFSQKITKFYDYRWNETEAKYARYYSEVERTDSGWRRKTYFLHKGTLQMDGYFEDSTCKIASGVFLTLYPDKKMESYGRYVHNRKQGLWLTFYPDGRANDSSVFENGRPVGVSMAWHRNGYYSDSAFYQPDGSGVHVSWFNNGSPSSAGMMSAGARQDGRWKYFHKNGKPSSIEIYDHGKFVDKQYFDEAGNQVADTANNDRSASFPGGTTAWLQFLSDYLEFPRHYEIANSDKAVVVITFTVDEDGKVQDTYVSTPFYPEFEKNALDIIRQSPKWIPAMNHNRRVRTLMHQPIIFSQVSQSK